MFANIDRPHCITQHKARCVVMNDISQDLLVFSKDISFQALSMSLQLNKWVDLHIYLLFMVFIFSYSYSEFYSLM